MSCGRELPREARPSAGGDAASGEAGGTEPQSGLRGTLGRIVGTTPRARMVSAGIAIAVIVAVVAFIALGADKETTVPQDGLTKAMDASCVHHKVEVAQAQAKAVNGDSLASVSTYADSVVRIAGQWRRELGRLDPPADRAELIEPLREALFEVQIEAGALARAAREAEKAEVAASAGRLDAATANVEEAIQNLELERCGRLIFGTGRLISE